MIPLEQIINDAKISITERNKNLPFPDEGEVRSCTLIYVGANNMYEHHLVDAQLQEGDWKIIRIDEQIYE